MVRYLDVPLLTGTSDAVARWMVERSFAPNHHTLIAHINANNYYWLAHRPHIRQRFLRVGTLLADGIGLRIGGLLFGHGSLPDLNGTDLFPLVMKQGQPRGLRVFLLGSKQGVVQQARSAIESRYPGVNVVGCRDGYFSAAEQQSVVEAIRQAEPHMLLVGLGFLRQEAFTLQHHKQLKVPLIWNVGGLFDFVSGAKSRAPAILRTMKLEWLFRFLREPRTMWHRNMVAAPWFLGHSLRAGLQSLTLGKKPSCDDAWDWQDSLRPRKPFDNKKKPLQSDRALVPSEMAPTVSANDEYYDERKQETWDL